MIKVVNIVKGTFLKWRGELVVVAEKEFYSPGKGAAVIRLKLKNVQNGKVIKEVLKTTENIEEIQVLHQKVQFMYKTKDNYIFMNPFTYEQVEIPKELVGNLENYIKEGEDYTVALWEGKPVELQVPKKMSFKVIKSEETARGNTVTGATKPVTLDNNAVVQVPLFVKEGDEISLNTETGEYAGRKN
jgi:elongation factor P